MDRMWAHDAPLSESMWVPQDSLTVTGSSTEISLSSEFPSPSSAPDSYPTINNNGILSVTGTSRPLFCATDRNTGLRFLVDTSPEVSAFPPNPGDPKLLKGTTPPRYENATLIPTNAGRFRRSGRALRQLLREGFFLASISTPILEAEFLSYYGLLVERRHKKLTSFTTIAVHSISSPSTAPSSVLAEFPEVTAAANLQSQPRHFVIHYVMTTGRPTSARLRLNIARREFANLLEKSIIRCHHFISSPKIIQRMAPLRRLQGT